MFGVHLYTTRQTMLLCMSRLMSQMRGEGHTLTRTLLARARQWMRHQLEGDGLAVMLAQNLQFPEDL